MAKVTFIPDKITVEVKDGENLLRAAMAAEVLVSAPCGGDGTCGKCRIVVESGATESKPSARLTEEQSAAGHVLACATEVFGDVVVSIPPESRTGSAPRRDQGGAGHMLSAEDFDIRLPRWDIDPSVTKCALDPAPPSLADNVSDARRVARALRRSHGVKDVEMALPALRKLASVLRTSDWTATALLVDSGRCHELVDIEAGDTTRSALAVAVDVGTTTIEAQLVDLADGRIVAHGSEYNAQVSHGEDVISRIIAASDEDGLANLHSLAIGSIRSLVEQMIADSGRATADIVCYVAAGNTVMTHLLLGLSPRTIRSEPYVPIATSFPWVRAAELGLPGSPEARLRALPCPASYVGGDIVAGLLAAGIPWSDKLSLYIDIGTNGEIALGSKDWLVACSCSAGPAFEGGGILHGMRAAAGAIEQVRIDPDTLEPMVLTVGLVRPVGICGSGLIDCVAELFLAGAIDRSGAFERALDTPRLREGDHGWEYVLALASESGTGSDIVVTEVDVENLMRAKAAMFAGISVLMESVDVTFDEIEEILIAGAFGRYLELDKVVTLGLLPEASADKTKFVGNGSLVGSRLAAMCRAMLGASDKVAEKLTYLELSVNAAFMEMYVSALFLPHTDLSLFPKTEARLKSRSGA